MSVLRMHVLWVALEQLAVGAVGNRGCCLGAGDILQIVDALCAVGTGFAPTQFIRLCHCRALPAFVGRYTCGAPGRSPAVP